MTVNSTASQALSNSSAPVDNHEESERIVPLADTYSVSLTTLAEPCWLVGEDDYERHFSTREDAQEYADRVNADHDEDDAPWEVHRSDERCALVSCAHCGYRFDEEGDGVTHFPEGDTTLVSDYDWIVDGEARVCQECSCAAIGHDPSRHGPWCMRCSEPTAARDVMTVDGAE